MIIIAKDAPPLFLNSLPPLASIERHMIIIFISAHTHTYSGLSYLLSRLLSDAGLDAWMDGWAGGRLQDPTQEWRKKGEAIIFASWGEKKKKKDYAVQLGVYYSSWSREISLRLKMDLYGKVSCVIFVLWERERDSIKKITSDWYLKISREKHILVFIIFSYRTRIDRSLILSFLSLNK